MRPPCVLSPCWCAVCCACKRAQLPSRSNQVKTAATAFDSRFLSATDVEEASTEFLTWGLYAQATLLPFCFFVVRPVGSKPALWGTPRRASWSKSPLAHGPNPPTANASSAQPPRWMPSPRSTPSPPPRCWRACPRTTAASCSPCWTPRSPQTSCRQGGRGIGMFGSAAARLLASKKLSGRTGCHAGLSPVLHGRRQARPAPLETPAHRPRPSAHMAAPASRPVTEHAPAARRGVHRRARPHTRRRHPGRHGPSKGAAPAARPAALPAQRTHAACFASPERCTGRWLAGHPLVRAFGMRWAAALQTAFSNPIHTVHSPQAAEVLAQLGGAGAASKLAGMDAAARAGILESMAPRDAARALAWMEDALQVGGGGGVGAGCCGFRLLCACARAVGPTCLRHTKRGAHHAVLALLKSAGTPARAAPARRRRRRRRQRRRRRRRRRGFPHDGHD